ncbi:hypothetical protein L228DRAFT_263014 [Xylona heveae TC161]|uniref:CASTOR ACT domain-containing protein n=1 Tax=Xylona heveae (strain CBS 132557 / TC161) TaxID=1328760 RepID=A0A165AER9_XYLHT|nr:hypothetical protein L228DRAFT_263014 [Xylona heveae TC161]KZF20357.1 hypothetical protein L228DRAFT_263014 [Xylona heveae TC161]
MEGSLTLINAKIQFLETRLSLIHIPLHLYSNFLQPILQLLLPSENGNGARFSPSGERNSFSWAAQHTFVNISVTPIECSVACSRESAEALFKPVLESLDASSRNQISISTEDYVVFQVDGEGLDAGQRVLELTTPLALAGISIFFITTYFSDYILVPLKSRGHVISALEERGFAFENSVDAFVNQSHHRNISGSGADSPNPPSTPPPANVSELQTRTFALLKRRNVVPEVDRDLRLVQCAGRGDFWSSGVVGGASSSEGRNETQLLLGLMKCLVHRPRFLSLTLTDTDPASLLLEQRLLNEFGSEEVLLGSKEDILVPITLDLRGLPLEATGIVCGVASKLVGNTAHQLEEAIDMSYLSTTRAGTVFVGEEQLARALEALKGPENGFIAD